jgi:hypothetical protein
VRALDLLGAEVRAEAERVGTRRECLHRRLLDPGRPASPLHLEGVRHHDAFEAELRAQQLDPGPAQGRRFLVQRREADMRGHHRANAGLDRRSKRRQRPRAQRFQIGFGDRQLEVRVADRLSVPGEVLGAGGNAGTL